MKKILVPIDFTPASRSAFEYVLWLSQLLETEVIAVHVYQEPMAEGTLSAHHLKKFQKKEAQRILNKLKRFTSYYPNLRNEKELAIAVPTLRLKKGNIVEAIQETAIEEAADLIVIGTKAKHNILEHLFGSVSSKLINTAKVPVMVIPEDVIFEPIKDIAFATELDLHEERALFQLFNFAQKLGAKVHQFFVNLESVRKGRPKEEVCHTSFNISEIEQAIDTGYANVTMVRDKTILRGIEYYLENHKIQILSMFIPTRTFFEQFLHTSQTKKMVYETRVPLLVYTEN